MSQIDKQAAQQEIERATQLRAKAEELVDIAAELEREAAAHTRDALDLMAPSQSSYPGQRR